MCCMLSRGRGLNSRLVIPRIYLYIQWACSLACDDQIIQSLDNTAGFLFHTQFCTNIKIKIRLKPAEGPA